ncbi:MAG: hypothetical protein ACE5PO_06840 [Candidatus Bathyarchaeia archaeon]
MRLSRRLVDLILSEIPEQALRNIGSSFGVTHSKHALSILGRVFNLENVEGLLHGLLTKHYHWFDVHVGKVEDVWTIHLSHGVGLKWSLFLSEYVSAMLGVLGFHRVEEPEMQDHYASLRLKRQMK